MQVGEVLDGISHFDQFTQPPLDINSAFRTGIMISDLTVRAGGCRASQAAKGAHGKAREVELPGLVPYRR